MALKIKSVTDAAKKYVERASVATQDYSAGVKGTTDWEAKALAGKEAYDTGVTEAIARSARETGISKAGNKKWQDKAATLGSQRFAPGVKAGSGDYQANVKPYFDVIANLTLTPRGPKGSPENYDRSSAVGEALHTEKVGT